MVLAKPSSWTMLVVVLTHCKELDTDGNTLTQDNTYIISPANSSAYSGGITLGKATNSKCPLNVIQNNHEQGIPVKFTIPESPYSDILTFDYLEIEFTDKPDCAESSKWLVFVDNTTQLKYVGIGGPENYHGVEIIDGKFLIIEYLSESSYSLVFCFETTGEWAPVGLKEFNSEEGTSRLVLMLVDDFRVKFVKDAPLNSVAGDKISNMR
ncbi:kunitz-type trypsin inhibitor-like 1 protein [Vicia villosa]|uniref:kunitz-type trypsin inhibitor-like 1 protein n=1 Tax=Vicia villosa TaxID=3911 RepID=UPI00273B09DB|nr:kunitz-type trypsin inhibitor-like 1 protein [Vicia villosa]